MLILNSFIYFAIKYNFSTNRIWFSRAIEPEILPYLQVDKLAYHGFRTAGKIGFVDLVTHRKNHRPSISIFLDLLPENQVTSAHTVNFVTGEEPKA